MKNLNQFNKKIFAFSANFFFIASQFSGLPAFAESLIQNPTQELRPVTAVDSNQKPVTSNPNEISIPQDALVPSSPLSVGSTITEQTTTTVTTLDETARAVTINRLPRKAESTNHQNVSYLVNNGKLEIYTEIDNKKYQRRVVDLAGSNIRTNGDISLITVSNDGKTIAVQSGQNVYALDLKAEFAGSSKFASLDPKRDGTVQKIEITEDGMINLVTTKTNHYSWARLASATQSNTMRVLNGTVVTASPTGQKFQIQLQGEDIYFYAIPSGERYLGKVDLNHEIYFEASLYDANEIYGVTVTDQGEVKIWLQNRTVQRPIAEYPIAIGMGTSVKLFSDGSYELTYQGKAYQSAGGNIQFGDGYKIRIDFANVIPIKISSVGGLSGSAELYLETKDGKLIVTKYTVIAMAADGTKETHRMVSYLRPEAGNALTLDGEGTVFIGSLPASQIFVNFDYLNQELNSIKFNDQGVTYSTVFKNDSDITEDKVAALIEQTTASLKSLIKDDLWIQTFRTVTTSDGVQFDHFVSNGKWYFHETSGVGKCGVEVNCEASQDLNGNWQLIFPQKDGTSKTYAIQIDLQNKVSLELKYPKIYLIGSPIVTADSDNAFSVTVRGPKQFSVSFASGAYVSDLNGVVQEDDGTRWTFQANENGDLSGGTIYYTDGRVLKFQISFSFVGKNQGSNQYIITQTESYNKNGVLEERRTVNDEDETFLDEKFCDNGNCSEPWSHFVIFNKGMDVSDLLTIRHPVLISSTVIQFLAPEVRVTVPIWDEIYVDVRHWTTMENGEPNYQFALKHYADGKAYQVYETEKFHKYSTFDLIAIQDRTTENLRKVLQNDSWLLEQGQIITASDGAQFKLVESNLEWMNIRRLTASGGVSMGDEVSLLYDKDGIITGIYSKQADRTYLRYDLSYDDQGRLQLKRRYALPDGLYAGQVYRGTDLAELLKKYAPQVDPNSIVIPEGVKTYEFHLVYSEDGKLAVGYSAGAYRKSCVSYPGGTHCEEYYDGPYTGAFYIRPEQKMLQYHEHNGFGALYFNQKLELVMTFEYGSRAAILDSVDSQGQIQKWVPDETVVSYIPVIGPDGIIPPKTEVKIEKWQWGKGMNVEVTLADSGRYVLEMSSDLNSWQTLKEYVVSQASSTQFWDENAESTARFYRIRKIS